MSEWQFRSTFCSVGLGFGRDPSAWEEVFSADDTDFSRDPSAVLILFHATAQCSLLIEPIGDLFGLSWEIRQADVHVAVVPCVSPDEMHLFERTEEQEAVPRGSLLDAVTTGTLVRAFLETPDELPTHVKWTSRFEISWPD